MKVTEQHVVAVCGLVIACCILVVAVALTVLLVSQVWHAVLHPC